MTRGSFHSPIASSRSRMAVWWMNGRVSASACACRRRPRSGRAERGRAQSEPKANPRQTQGKPMSLRAELLRLGIRIFLKRGTHHLDIETWRKDMRATEKFVPRPPARSQTTKVNAGRLTFHRVTTEASRAERHVLYLHGGAYVSGAPAYYRHFTWRIADAVKGSVWALEYRLAPEHPFPAALEDAVAGYHWLLDNTPDTRRLFVMGDSAGAGVALCLLLKVRDEGRPLPAAAVAMSPWTDLALAGLSLPSDAAAG